MNPHPNINEFQPPFFFISNDRNTIVQFASESIRQVLGFAPRELIGRSYIDLLVTDHPFNENANKLHQRRFTGDNNQSTLLAVHDTQKQVRIIKLQTYGERNRAGIVIANHGLAQDVSESFKLHRHIGKRLQLLNELDSRLTAKEKKVLNFVLDGRLNKSIARELAVSERAIEMTRSRVMAKFDAQNSAELIAKAVELRTLKKVLSSPLENMRPEPDVIT